MESEWKVKMEESLRKKEAEVYKEMAAMQVVASMLLVE